MTVCLSFIISISFYINFHCFKLQISLYKTNHCSKWLQQEIKNPQLKEKKDWSSFVNNRADEEYQACTPIG